jgi:1,4-alpha-glucan branching enzyme
MKSFLMFFWGISISVLGLAQVTTTPALPTDSDEVVITFNAVGTALENYTGNVYAHTGVMIEGVSTWQYVKGTWGNNTTQPVLTKISANTYTLTITPSVRQYYAVPADKVIEKMAFVFRSQSSPYKQTSPDIFVNVYAQGLSVNISSPSSDKPFYAFGSTLSIAVQANYSDNIALFINNTEVATSTNASLNFDFEIDAYGKQWVKVLASNQTQEIADSVYFFVKGNVPVAELPENVIPGINITGENEVTLVLQDPPAQKEFVFAIGDFSEWELDENYYMNRTPDGKHYWVTISNLEPTQEYIYQYWIDGEVKIADPYTEKISDPWNDKWISNTNYPNLIKYPDGKTTGIASVFQIQQEEYTWEATGFTPPAKGDLVIYELHIRDFVTDDYIMTVLDKLDYLEKLGVNAIELMPINEFEGNDSWGYNPSFFFATDKAYGTKNNYKKFIDECHKRGIAVIIDMVLNHAFGQSPFVQMYFDAQAGTYGQPTADNPWFNETCPHEPWCWGFDFDHKSDYTMELIDRIAEYWLTEFKVDGFRLDFTKGFTNTQTANQGSAYDIERINILKRYADFIWSINPDAYVILEHFCDNSEEKVLAQYRSDEGMGMLTWGNLNHSYTQASMGWSTDWDFKGISYIQRGWSVPHLVGYMESHDEERMMYKNITFGNSTNLDHNIKNLSVALKRQKLAGAFFFTIPGPKMIWQFGELGYDFSIDYNSRVGRKPIRWDYYDNEDRRDLYNTWAELIALRKAYPTFSTTNFALSLNAAGKRIYLYHNDMNVVIIGNFGVTATSISLTFPQTGNWFEYFSQTQANYATAEQSFTLQPGEYRLYSNQFINRNDYAVSINPLKPSQGNFKVDVWPNPVSSNLSIGIYTDKPQSADIFLCDVNGRTIASVYTGELNAGDNTIDWTNNSGLGKGVYFLIINTQNLREVRRVIIK